LSPEVSDTLLQPNSTGSTVVTLAPGVSLVLEASGSVILPLPPLEASSALSGALTGLSESGSIALSPIAISVDTSILIPKELYLYDTDANQKIDRLVVKYSGTLSGTLSAEKFVIFSASG